MTTAVQTATEVRPFKVDVPQEALDDLRRRIAATRWPSKELVADRSQGVQLETLKDLADYWEKDHDWRRTEAKLNALPQFKTEIDGVYIHFIHVKSPHENALPLIMTHGWPGSVIELLETIGPLTDPTAHGGSADDAFHLVLPSVPGFGFSGEPAEIGWHPGRVAAAWGELMRRLGYSKFVAQGGDVGAFVTDQLGRLAPSGLVGIHTNLLVTMLGGGGPPPTADSDEERAAIQALTTFRNTGFGYFVEQATRPQTIGYALLDSPIALAGWMLDHDTDSYEKITSAFVKGQPAGNLTREHIVDNISLYWLSGTGASAARAYWESGRIQALAAASGQAPPPVSVPVGFSTFPGEIFAAPRSWVEKSYPTMTYFNKAERGGHFAAWEEPEIFSNELRNAFRSVR
jgi:pimeloyl-ACP methyl ester carboxylesterase